MSYVSCFLYCPNILPQEHKLVVTDQKIKRYTDKKINNSSPPIHFLQQYILLICCKTTHNLYIYLGNSLLKLFH